MSGEAPPVWDRFRQWVHCICVVSFDLELGQVMEVVYPGDTALSSSEKMNICYLAFPDSNSACASDERYHFRIRRTSSHVSSPVQAVYRQRAPSAIDLDPGHLFGFVHFRQHKDSTLPRGYFQKSVVLISVLPLLNLFGQVVETLAQGYFTLGEPAIEAGCHDLDQFEAPIPGEILQLPLMGRVIQCRIPCKNDMPFAQKQALVNETVHSIAPSPIVLSSVYEPNLDESLTPVLVHLHTLWELVMIGEPLVVMAPTPSVCSSLVQALISLIWPLRACQDYRPFFTIHDSEFREYTAKSMAPSNVILGVTNPFFAKTLQHWPHIVRVGEGNTSGKQMAMAQKTYRKPCDGRSTKPGFYSHYRPHLTPTKSLLRKLVGRAERPVGVQSTLIKREMLELTHSFMMPIERYLSTLMPLQRQLNSVFQAPPRLRQFNVEEFIKTGLDSNGPALTSNVRGDWLSLYRRFLSSRNFDCWLRERKRDLEGQLSLRYLDLLCNADLSSAVIQMRHQVEIVDLVLRLKDRIANVETDPMRREKLQSQLATVMAGVDEELKSVLFSNGILSDHLILQQRTQIP